VRSILHVVENLDDSYGGPARSVPNLAARTRDFGWDVHLMSIAWSSTECNEVIRRESLGWDRFPLVGPRKICVGRGFSDALYSNVAGSQTIVHLHTLWNAVSVSSVVVAKTRRVPLVVSVRGALYPWSLRQGRVRKAVAWRLFLKKALQGAAFIHVTEPNEGEAVRGLGIRVPIVIVPNGVEQVSTNDLQNILSFRAGRTGLGRKFLFLSRIHKKKGLDILLRAWALSIARGMSGQLIVAGPFSSNAYEKEIRTLVKDLGIGDSVRFLGMLTGNEREEAFRIADVFVLPSHTENFGVAIVEALARGLPVLTTTGTPWKAIEANSAGWWIDLSLDQLIFHLDFIAGLSRNELAVMGSNAVALAANFSWATQAKKLQPAYEWALGGPAPEGLFSSHLTPPS
jgi:glycosyltransferase involved in cell wall biosynthesis